jgi:hypothetical protein
MFLSLKQQLKGAPPFFLRSSIRTTAANTFAKHALQGVTFGGDGAPAGNRLSEAGPMI